MRRTVRGAKSPDTMPKCPTPGIERSAKTCLLATDVFVDLAAAAVTQHRAAPVELAAAFLDDRASPSRIAAPAAHHLAAVGAVGGPVAPAPGRARRPRALVGVAEVRRRLDVDELRRTGTTAGDHGRRLDLCPVKQTEARRALETSARPAFTYQRHLQSSIHACFLLVDQRRV